MNYNRICKYKLTVMTVLASKDAHDFLSLDITGSMYPLGSVTYLTLLLDIVEAAIILYVLRYD